MTAKGSSLRASRLFFMALGVVLLLTSCGQSTGGGAVSSDPAPKAKTFQQALPRVKAMVDAAAVVVAAGYHVEPDPGFQPTGCENSSGQDDGTVTAPYNLKFALPEGTDIGALFEKARTYWQGQGYQVSQVNLAIGDPAMEADRDEYKVSLHVVKKTNMAYLGGDTPCLPDATRK